MGIVLSKRKASCRKMDGRYAPMPPEHLRYSPGDSRAALPKLFEVIFKYFFNAIHHGLTISLASHRNSSFFHPTARASP
jgi:hypothetical protein